LIKIHNKINKKPPLRRWPLVLGDWNVAMTERTTGYKRFGKREILLSMRIVGLSLLFCLAACSSMPSVSQEGLGQSAWRHQRAVEDANIIMQGMNRARTDAEWFAKQP
jgi:hypothetical protein